VDIHQDKKNISDIKFGPSNRKILFGGDNIYSEIIDTETKTKSSNIIENCPNVSEIVYLNEDTIAFIAKDQYIYVQSI